MNPSDSELLIPLLVAGFCADVGVELPNVKFAAGGAVEPNEVAGISAVLGVGMLFPVPPNENL